MIRDYINQFTKLVFLPAFYGAYKQSITEENICASFRGSGLLLHDLEAVLSKLDVKHRTPTPPAPEVTLWEAKTPSNASELGAQSTLTRDRVRRHKSSPPASIIAALDQLKKGAEVMGHEATRMRDRIARLEKANEAVTTRKRERKKKKGGEVDLAAGHLNNGRGRGDYFSKGS